MLAVRSSDELGARHLAMPTVPLQARLLRGRAPDGLPAGGCAATGGGQAV